LKVIIGTPLKKDLEALENPGINSFEHISVSAKPYEWGLGSTPRTAELRESLYSKAVLVKDWTDMLTGMAKPNPDLQVRIAGYSAYFVDLAPETQESIIMRTEQGFA